MIKSMTGFGRAEKKDEEKTILVEMRSVNNKYLKINIRIPELLTGYEERIERLLKKELLRGTINLTIDYKTCDQSPKCVINKEVLKEYSLLCALDVFAGSDASLREPVSSEKQRLKSFLSLIYDGSNCQGHSLCYPADE